MHVAIVGGSLTGLAAANVLIRLGHTVTVFEKSAFTFQNRGSSLGFVDVPLWEYIRGGETMLRRGKRAHRSQGAYYYGDLWKFLYQGLPEGVVIFNKTVTSLGDDNMRPIIDEKVYDSVIIADGGWSALRRYVNGAEKEPEYSGHVTYRCKLAKEEFPEFEGEGAYTVGRYFAIALNVAQSNGENFIMGGVAIGTPESEIVRPIDGVSRHADAFKEPTDLPTWFIPFIRRTFAQAADGQVVRWLELAATRGKITATPLFEFMAENVCSGRLIVMGDAAHMASPRTAAGAHTGILDAVGLFQAFSDHPEDIDAAIAAYEPGGRLRAQELYVRSKQVSRPFTYVADDDRRGI